MNRRAFLGMVAGVATAVLVAKEAPAYPNQWILVDSYGGYLVPKGFDAELLRPTTFATPDDAKLDEQRI
jgi:hypothetical protein